MDNASRALANVSYLPLDNSVRLRPAGRGNGVRRPKCFGLGGQFMRRIGMEQTTRVLGEDKFESVHSAFRGLARTTDNTRETELRGRRQSGHRDRQMTIGCSLPLQ